MAVSEYSVLHLKWPFRLCRYSHLFFPYLVQKKGYWRSKLNPSLFFLIYHMISWMLNLQTLCHLSAHLHNNDPDWIFTAVRCSCSLLKWPAGGGAGSRVDRQGVKPLCNVSVLPVLCLFLFLIFSFILSVSLSHWHIILSQCHSHSFSLFTPVSTNDIII